MITFEKFQIENYSDCLIVTDERIARLYSIYGDNVFFLPEGEKAKSFEWAEKLCEWFLAKGLERSGRVVAVGGGSVGDTAGFAASIYMRGVNLTHVPTTLLAQIDSGIGGKTAINLFGVKNAVGTFYPADTLIDTRFLKTLNVKQMLNGKGELLKYEMLSENIERIAEGKTEDIVKECALFKESVCNADPYDVKGIRAKLNFGHTVGHSFELLYGIPHGTAVANGIYYETKIALSLNLCDKPYAEKWIKKAEKSFEIYPVSDKALELMKNDKKNADGKICFVLPKDFLRTALSFTDVCNILKNA